MSNDTKWPACGAADCYAPATWADDSGVGWCDSHRDLALDIVRRANSADDFDDEWMLKVGLPVSASCCKATMEADRRQLVEAMGLHVGTSWGEVVEEVRRLATRARDVEVQARRGCAP